MTNRLRPLRLHRRPSQRQVTRTILAARARGLRSAVAVVWLLAVASCGQRPTDTAGSAASPADAHAPRPIRIVVIVDKSASVIGNDVRIGAFVVVGNDCRIGDRSVICHGCVLCDGVTIGERTLLYHNVTVREQCRIGSDVIIHPGVTIGSDGFGFAPKPDGSYEKIPQLGIVVDSYFGLCFESLSRAALPVLYDREGVATTFEIGEYWDKTTLIDVVGLRQDGWTDLGECKWGEAVIPAQIVGELLQRVPCYPITRNATVAPRVFTRRPVTERQRSKHPSVRFHSLEELYGDAPRRRRR